jgi:hypothetical protein
MVMLIIGEIHKIIKLGHKTPLMILWDRLNNTIKKKILKTLWIELKDV